MNTGVSVLHVNDPTYATPADPRQLVGVMRARMPYSRSELEVFRNASTPGSTVVTFTSQGAKSSATRSHHRWIMSRSCALNVDGSPSVSYGADTIDGSPDRLFHDVPSVTWPSTSRKIVSLAPGRLASWNASAVDGAGSDSLPEVATVASASASAASSWSSST
jgi:hypothetical protein